MATNQARAEAELKVRATEILTRAVRELCLQMYQSFRKLGIGYSEFLEVWLKAVEDVYERDSSHLRSDDDSGRSKKSIRNRTD